MLRKLCRKAKLLFNPLENGEVLYGDCLDFGMTELTEQCWHGLRTISGDLCASFWSGDSTYKLTLTKISMLYYVFECEVLTKSIGSHGGFIWNKRIQARKPSRSVIDNMIVTGKLKRVKI